MADGLAAEFNSELALVLSKDNGTGRWRGLFLSSEGQRGARHDSQCQCDRTYSEFHGTSYPASILSHGRGFSTTRCAVFPADATMPRRRISATTCVGSPELSTR